jgi:ABC transporter transmembrane region
MDQRSDHIFDQANQAAFEGVQALQTVHSYNLQRCIAELYRQLLDAPLQRSLRNAFLSGAGYGIGQFAMFAVNALAFWYGGQEVKRGRMDVEEVVRVLFAIMLAAIGAAAAQMQFPDVAKGGQAVARIFRGTNPVMTLPGIRTNASHSLLQSSGPLAGPCRSEAGTQLR